MLDLPKVYTGPSLINKVPQRQFANVAFRGGERNTDNGQAEHKLTDKNNESEKVTVLKRLEKFFNDIGQALKTLFGNKWSWRFDDALGKLGENIRSIGKDKDAEAVMQDFYKRNQGELKALTLQMPGTPEQKRKREKDIAEGEEAQKQGVLVQVELTDIAKSLNDKLESVKPKEAVEFGLSFIDGQFLDVAKTYMETRIQQGKKTD